MAQMHGSLDAVGDGLARGWAQDLNDPLTPQVIEVFADGELAVEGIANGFREDLREAGVGDGRAALAERLYCPTFARRTASQNRDACRWHHYPRRFAEDNGVAAAVHRTRL